jgi:K+-transporting ATPase KdpF subunit
VHALHVICSIVVALILLYLVAALLFPERFE